MGESGPTPPAKCIPGLWGSPQAKSMQAECPFPRLGPLGSLSLTTSSSIAPPGQPQVGCQEVQVTSSPAPEAEQTGGPQDSLKPLSNLSPTPKPTQGGLCDRSLRSSPVACSGHWGLSDEMQGWGPRFPPGGTHRRAAAQRLRALGMATNLHTNVGADRTQGPWGWGPTHWGRRGTWAALGAGLGSPFSLPHWTATECLSPPRILALWGSPCPHDG